MRLAALALGLVVVVGACASSGTAAGDQTVTRTSTTSRTNVISTQELRESRATNLEDLIRQTRPGWARNLAVALNNDLDPSGTALRRSPSTVAEIRLLSKSEAQNKWGSGIRTEVIQVVTR